MSTWPAYCQQVVLACIMRGCSVRQLATSCGDNDSRPQTNEAIPECLQDLLHHLNLPSQTTLVKPNALSNTTTLVIYHALSC